MIISAVEDQRRSASALRDGDNSGRSSSHLVSPVPSSVCASDRKSVIEKEAGIIHCCAGDEKRREKKEAGEELSSFYQR